ncbi:hypothetical protein IL306_004566 [Fusarium sp. DS 682]|nr:hypothetical protein IL306_004566 [Fusarium sp. DS 682]
MADFQIPKRYALLVGIDLYLNDGSRKLGDGQTLSLDSLDGCVNDVTAVKAFLQKEYQLDALSVLTSSASKPTNEQPRPMEPPEYLPTFANIKREFDAAHSQTRAGDFFLFHFSGHGAELSRVKASPAGRLKDPSLLTADFCCGQPAVRGWQLNMWLKRLNEKKVHVVVILDSCHSGGAFRAGDRFRTPNNWTMVPNLPADELAADDPIVEHASRGAKVQTSWFINPEGFTLMAACDSHERAAERVVNGKAGGAFTHELLQYLEFDRPSGGTVTYRTLRDHIAQRVHGQNPKVFGRDRLLFFGSTEPFLATPLVVRLESDTVVLPVGRVHGVQRRSEFTPYLATYETSFAIEEVDDIQCTARISSHLAKALEEHGNRVIPSRWSLGPQPFQVLVSSGIGTEFESSLSESLQSRIASPIQIIKAGQGRGTSTNLLRVEKLGDGIKILGPDPLIGYSGPVRGLKIQSANIEELAAETAISLAHLARFKQILDLRAEASMEPPPFEVAVKAKARDVDKGPLPPEEKLQLIFNNKSEDELFYTVMVLGSGFEIEQIFPAEDSPACVPPGGRPSPLNFYMEIPLKLKVIQVVDESTTHRDIVRVLVTQGKPISWKSLELPLIWNASQVGLKHRTSSPRRAVVTSGFKWWAKDFEIISRSS